MWETLSGFGVPETAQVLEPGSGIGNFIAGAPSKTRITGVELDPTSAGIAQLLHPNALVRAESFADTQLHHDGYDAVIGNVPFGQATLYDRAYNPKSLSLHNHFLLKSLRMTKPGGVVAVMTSRWTLDSNNERARREIAKYGQLLGAVRMPRGAHQEVAGTEALIDVLVLRRHEDGHVEGPDPSWIFTEQIFGAGGIARSNAYFNDHPEQVIGKLDTRIGRFGPEVSVEHPQAEDPVAIADALGHSLRQVVASAAADGMLWDAAQTVVTDRPVAVTVQDQRSVIGRIFESESGVLLQNGLGGASPVEVPKNAVRELKHLLELRDIAVSLLEAEASSAEATTEMSALRTELGESYDRYVASFGPLGRVSTTVKDRAGKEPLIMRRFPAAIRALRDDPHFATVAALERYNEDTGEGRKASIFFDRVIRPELTVVVAETPLDAMNISLDREGRVDLDLIGELLDIPTGEVPETIAELIFADPLQDGHYLPSREYLSGNVRAKLKVVRELAETDARFQRHVSALEEVVPDPLGPAEIDVKLGATWVGAEHVRAWVENVTGRPVSSLEHIGGDWKFRLSGTPEPVTESKWCVIGDHTAKKMVTVISDVLNGKKLQMTYQTDKDGPRLVDTVATEALQERAEQIQDHFADWLWKDAVRGTELQERYNDLFNGIALRSYDGVELTFPGKAASFKPHPHQHAAVARMLAEPTTGLFHEVGAGKTSEMVMGVMELKRLGMTQKPAIIVPNQMLEQFTREFKQIYPRAEILSAGGDDLAVTSKRDGRKLFVARAATGNWDAVILTHSAFTRMGLGDAGVEYAEKMLSESRDILEEKLASDLSKDSVKTLEAQLAREEERIKKMVDIPRDEGTTFEDTGIDYLCVDEAHLFKNLTVISTVDDLAKPVGSQRAIDLEMKLWYLREKKQQSRIATLATATPLPNSMIEMYVMQRYLRPDMLQEAGVYRADDWARQFTEQVTAVEYKAEGGSYQVKTRTTKFRNLPELLRMWHVPGDVKTQADLNLKVPSLALNEAGEPAPVMVVVPATAAQAAGMADLIVRGEDVRAGLVQPEEDNMLKITSNGRAYALDARLMGEAGPAEDEVTKLDIIADRVHSIWEDTSGNEYLNEWGEPSPTLGGLQIVFSDLGTPREGVWNAYDHLRSQLVSLGVPREQVRFIHEAGNDVAKAELFQQCRDGRVRVLMGSTEKMGVGTNIQDRAVALHHVDAPWRPADVTQREGRAIRQKNQNPEVGIYRYATEGSFDAYMWGTLARKAHFIEQVLTGRLDVREADHSPEQALQFAEMQAITAGDMRILELADLKQDVLKLTRNQKAHARKIGAFQAMGYQSEMLAGTYRQDIAELGRLQDQVQPTQGDLFVGMAVPARWAARHQVTEREQFGENLRHHLGEAKAALGGRFSNWHEHYPAPLGVKVEIGGMTWAASLKWNTSTPANPTVVFQGRDTWDGMKVQMPWNSVSEGEASQLSRRFESRANSIPENIDRLTKQLAKVEAEQESFATLAAEPWAKQEEYAACMSRLQSLTRELEKEAADAVSRVEEPLQKAQHIPAQRGPDHPSNGLAGPKM